MPRTEEAQTVYEAHLSSPVRGLPTAMHFLTPPSYVPPQEERGSLHGGRRQLMIVGWVVRRSGLVAQLLAGYGDQFGEGLRLLDCEVS